MSGGDEGGENRKKDLRVFETGIMMDAGRYFAAISFLTGGF
jgi:hypothetical protein